MFYLKCDKCDNMLVFDYDKTLEEYLSTIKGMKLSNLTHDDIKMFLYFRCDACNSFSYYDEFGLVKRIKSLLYKDIVNIKKHEMLRGINPKSINPDNGLEYCGKCDGVDGEGNCYVDLIKQCHLFN